jgi:hypothetical protein
MTVEALLTYEQISFQAIGKTLLLLMCVLPTAAHCLYACIMLVMQRIQKLEHATPNGGSEL